MRTVWCNDIELVDDGYRLTKDAGRFSMDAPPKWMYCPVCGTPRPRELTERDICHAIIKKWNGTDHSTCTPNCGTVDDILERFTLKKP